MTLLALAILPFLFAPLAGWLGGRSLPVVAVLPLALFGAFMSFLGYIADGQVVVEAQPWIPSLGIAAAFRLDGLSLTFALLITGIGSAVFLYASGYLSGAPRLARFYVVLTLFMASMLGAVLADDLVLLVVFWELTSITSFLLIGYTPEKAEARRSAQQGFLVTVAGGLAMLAGVILLGSVAGTFSLTAILERGEVVAAHPIAPAIILLIAAGAFAKSAQAPLHSWLANAMVAPTPVSAFLHSATMVKLGVYFLARLDPAFSDHSLWIVLLSSFGAATMVVGAVLALRETDLKRVLAYSTIVSLGTLVMLIGMTGELAAVAVITFLIVHALYKACLFLIAGIIDHETGTRDSSALGGLRHAMPITAAAALLLDLAATQLSGIVIAAERDRADIGQHLRVDDGKREQRHVGHLRNVNRNPHCLFAPTSGSERHHDIAGPRLSARSAPVVAAPRAHRIRSSTCLTTAAHRAKETRDFATALNLVPCFTPVKNSESNGMSEAFVKTFKRDYLRISPLPDAPSVLRQIPGWIDD